MQKKSSLCAVLVLVISLIGCGKEEEPEEAVRLSVSVAEEAVQDEGSGEQLSEEAAATEEAVQISDLDIQKLEVTLEMQWDGYEKLREKAELYDGLGNGITEAELRELVQSEIIKCYEENTLLAVELKTLILGSVGVDVPSGFATGDKALEDYAAYVKNTISEAVTANIDGVISEVAGDEVKEILKDGVNGAVAEYKKNGTFEDVLLGAYNSITDGVTAKIQNELREQAVAVLDETTGGLFSVVQEMQRYDSAADYFMDKADKETGGLLGSISGITGYDATPGALLQSVSASAKSSVWEIKNFLDKETLTSADISEMMYSFSNFAMAMDTLAEYGAEVNFSWNENYKKMQLLYDGFMNNEVMIEMLSSRGDIANCQIDASMLYELPETEGITYLYDAPVLREDEAQLSNSEKYEILTMRMEELGSAVEVLQNKLAALPDLAAELADYRAQIEQTKNDCSALISYEVLNFTAGYDSAGLQTMEDFNKMSNAVGEIAKFTPYGFFVNMLTSMAISNTDDYYEVMERINNSFAACYEQIVLEAREAVAVLESRINFYDDLVTENDNMNETFNNLSLLRYMLENNSIDLSAYETAAEEKLYLLALQADVMKNIYQTLYEDSSFTNVYAKQYGEIMDIVDPGREGIMEDVVSIEEMEAALVPILRAGVEATFSMKSTLNSPYDERRISAAGGNACFVFSPNGSIIQASHSKGGYSINYFSDGSPFFINGYYVYNGRVLNPTEEMDEALLLEHAKWIRENYTNKKFAKEVEDHIRVLKSFQADGN